MFFESFTTLLTWTLQCNVSFSWASEQQRNARIITFQRLLANSYSHKDFALKLNINGGHRPDFIVAWL